MSEEIKAFEAKREAEELAKGQEESEIKESNVKKARSKLTAKRSTPFEKPSKNSIGEEPISTETPALESAPQESKPVSKKNVVLNSSDKAVVKRTEGTIDGGDFKTDNVEHVEL